MAPDSVGGKVHGVAFPDHHLSTRKTTSVSGILVPDNSLLIAYVNTSVNGAMVGTGSYVPGRRVGTVALVSSDIRIDCLFRMLATVHRTLHQRKRLNKKAVPLVGGDSFSGVIIPVPSRRRRGQVTAVLSGFSTLAGSVARNLPHRVRLHRGRCRCCHSLLLDFPGPRMMTRS